MPTHNPTCASLNRSMWANCDCNVSLYKEMDSMNNHDQMCEKMWSDARCGCKERRVHKAVFGEEEPLPAWEQALLTGSYPVSLTVYTTAGNVTVNGVREDSIEVKDGNLIAEGTDTSSKTPLFTFPNVIGWSTVIE